MWQSEHDLVVSLGTNSYEASVYVQWSCLLFLGDFPSYFSLSRIRSTKRMPVFLAACYSQNRDEVCMLGSQHHRLKHVSSMRSCRCSSTKHEQHRWWLFIQPMDKGNKERKKDCNPKILLQPETIGINCRFTYRMRIPLYCASPLCPTSLPNCLFPSHSCRRSYDSTTVIGDKMTENFLTW